MKKQRGFINLDGLVPLFYLALIGILALFAAGVFCAYQLIKHFF